MAVSGTVTLECELGRAVTSKVTDDVHPVAPMVEEVLLVLVDTRRTLAESNQ